MENCSIGLILNPSRALCSVTTLYFEGEDIVRFRLGLNKPATSLVIIALAFSFLLVPMLNLIRSVYAAPYLTEKWRQTWAE